MRPTTLLLLCLLLAGCSVTASNELPAPAANARAKADWWNDGQPMTREKASAMCWMKTEQGGRGMSVEKRADQVNACVAETMRNPPK